MYNKRKILLLLLILTLVFSLFTVYVYSSGALSLSARAAILYEPTTKSVLFSKNSDKRLAMASTTKIMSALVALESSDIYEIFTVDDRAIGVEGSSIYIEKGESFLMLDLIYAMLLSSANDAAAAIAYKISGSIEGFADLMNEKAKSLGLTNTSFQNPHGLDSENHYTTARELAIIAAAALENETFKKISSTKNREIVSSLKDRLLVNHNKLLNMYDGAIGVKTGFTKKSGRSLVGASERDGVTLISVTINAPDDWNDHKKLFDYGYSLLESRVVLRESECAFRLPVLSSDSEYITVKNENELRLVLSKNDNIEKKIFLPRYAVAPVKKGDVLGYVAFYKNGVEISRDNLVACDNAEPQKSKLPFL